MTTSWSLSGRWTSGGYNAINLGSYASGPAALGTVSQPSHPIMTGVTTFLGGASSYRNNGALASGASLIASWTDGLPLVAEKTSFVGHDVGLNFYPPSTD